MSIENIAVKPVLALLDDVDLPLEVARTIQHDLAELLPRPSVGDCFMTERLMFLDAVIRGFNRGVGSYLRWIDDALDDQSFHPLDYVAFDRNIVLRAGNKWYDRLDVAANIPRWNERQGALRQIYSDLRELESNSCAPHRFAPEHLGMRNRSNWLAATLLMSFLQGIENSHSSQDVQSVRLQLVELAAALAVYRADHGDYPDRLEQLIPNVIPGLPVDLYHDKPFIYHRDADGYLLYSCGPNGIDDGGSHEDWDILAGRELGFNEDLATEKLRQQIPPGADDHALRVPRPAFKLPTPPASSEAE